MLTLSKGDVVEIVAPASGCSETEYNDALDFVSKFGLTPRARTYNSVIKPGLCANSVEYRFKHLIDAIESKDSKAVWCLKGGYGSQQLLEKLDELVDPPQEKIFIGFSDITILLNYFADRWGWTCIHGPMPGQVGKVEDITWQNLADVIFGKKNNVSFFAKPVNQAATMPGEIVGKFLGGCLSLMQALIGTSHMPDLELSVLFLEDDKFESPRRIDRILNHMQRAGVFDSVEAVLLGRFLEEEKKDELELQEVLESLADYLDKLGIPLLQNTQLGHGKNMLTVPIGGIVNLKLGDKPEVVIRA